MAHLTGRIAPALLASLVAMSAVVAARAETPAAPSASDCLAKPNGPAAKGSHWYYRIQHASGRHCWYQHAIDAARAAKNTPVQPHAAVEKAAPPPPRAAASAIPTISEASAAPTLPTADNAANVMPPVAAPPIAAPVNEPPGWPAAAVSTASPAATLPALPTAALAAVPGDRLTRSVEPAPPPPAPEPKVEALQPQLDAAASKRSPAHTPDVARDGEFAEPTTHMPALLGAVSALAIIIIGSFAGRLLTKRPPKRPQRQARAHDWDAPVSSMEDDSPGIVPIMPGGGDSAHETSAGNEQALRSPDDWGLRRSRSPRRATPPDPRPETPPPSRETTRVLEENVRELLHRLQGDLRGEPAKADQRKPKASTARRTAPPASADSQAYVPSEQELDAVLAIWRAKRSG